MTMKPYSEKIDDLCKPLPPAISQKPGKAFLSFGRAMGG